MLQEIDLKLNELIDQFTLTQGRSPILTDIQNDSKMYTLFQQKKLLEMENAIHIEGYCCYYIPRRRRYCKLRATDSCSGFCSEHFELLYNSAKQNATTAVSSSSLPHKGEYDTNCDLLERIANSFCDSKRYPAEYIPLENEFEIYSVHNSTSRHSAWNLKTNIRRRMKKMTNPLAKQFNSDIPAVDWSRVYDDPTLPLFVDIGSAKGRYLLKLSMTAAFATEYGPHNFLGIEIFKPLVVAANHTAQEKSIRNLYYIHGSANHISFINILKSYKLHGAVSIICVQFPDPWFDSKINRRVLTSRLLFDLTSVLAPYGHLYVATDVLILARDMRKIIVESQLFHYHEKHFTHGSRLAWGECASETEVEMGRRVLNMVPCDLATSNFSPEITGGINSVSMVSIGTNLNATKTLAIEQHPQLANDITSVPLVTSIWNENNIWVSDSTSTLVNSSEGNLDIGIDVDCQWLRLRPYFVATERDQVCERKNHCAVYRMLFVRK